MFFRLLVPLLLTTVSASTYQYNLDLTLVNMGDTLLPDFHATPYYCLLNQNIFPNTTYQTVILKEVLFDGLPAKFTISEDLDGNPWISIQTNRSIGRGENATVSITFLIEVKDRAFDLSDISNISEIPRELSDKYSLVGLWNLSNLQIEELSSVARSIKGDEENALLIVLKILKWFEENVSYNPNLKVPQDIWTTFLTRSGDCDDQANLFVMFCRILGIPAYTSLGPIYLPGTQQFEEDNNMVFNLTNLAWHGWAMVYLPTKTGGGWYPVDLTFFRGAYYQNSHIKSQNLLDHINGSAFSRWVTLQYQSINHIDYVKETVDTRNAIISSNTRWIESHSMIPVIGSAQPIMPIGDLYLLLFVFAIVTILYLFHRSRSGVPQKDSSSS